MIGFVYIWINKINGKKYIGLHKGSPSDNYIGSGVYFKKAIKKHGIENFERKILYEEYNNEEQLYQKEFDIINELNAVFSMKFYNLTNYDPKYVQFIKGEKKRYVSEETKRKISKSAKGRKLSEETKKKMSRTRIGKSFKKKNGGNQYGEKNPQFGKKWYNNDKIDKTFILGKEPAGWKLGRIKGRFVGERNPFFGKKHTEETKRKISTTKSNSKKHKEILNETY
jgi:hypothetical protein